MLERIKQQVVDRLGVTRLAAQADRLDAEVGALRSVQADLLAEAERRQADLDRLTDQVRYLVSWSRIHMASAWAASIPLLHQPEISIVLPTRDRSALLRSAIESVRAQTYPNWRLIVVDDGSTDATGQVLADCADERLSVVRTDGIGAAAARNRGLELASGDLVAFLDDDNVMAPGWLRAVAEYTGRVPDCELLYGAQIRESEPGEVELHGERSVGGLHLLFVDPFDRRRLADHNYVDLGAIVVRRDHPELRFDESLDIFIDWELIARLTASTAPHPLPVVAGLYRTGAERRITGSPHRSRRFAEMQQRLAALIRE